MRTRLAVLAGPLAWLLLAYCAACSGPEQRPVTTTVAPLSSGSHPGRNFDQLIEDYLDYTFRTFPTWGTWAGYHRYDDRFFDFRQSSIQKTLIGLRGFQHRLQAIARDGLTRDQAADHDIITHHIAEKIYLLADLREWASNPVVYVDEILFGLDELMAHEYRPLADRTELVISREKQIGRVLAAARDNLVRPNGALVEHALDTLGSALIFLAETLPESVSSVEDADLLGRFRKANREAIDEIKAFYDFLQRSQQGGSQGTFTLGEEALGKLLDLREMVDLPVPVLLEIGEHRLEEKYRAFLELAGKIGAGLSPEEALALMHDDHGEPDNLLDDTAAVVQQLRRFVDVRKLVTLPAEQPLRVAPMPAYQFGLAILHSPGPLEPDSLGSYYYVAPVERDWEDDQIDAHLRAFSRPTMIVTSIHETYPGHYVHNLHIRQCPSKVRRVFQSYAFVEGWAYYCEEMVLSQGLYEGDPAVNRKLVVLAQRHDELLRLCRLVAAIRMHTGSMTIEEAGQLFVEKGLQEPETAKWEAERAAFDPMVVSYSLGKMMIEKLRDDYAAMKGEAFSLLEFHDRLLDQGAPPIPVLRHLLLGETDPGPVL